MPSFTRLALVILVSLCSFRLVAQDDTPVVSKPINGISLTADKPSVTIDLRDYFTYQNVSGTVVQFSTSKGLFNAMLYSSAAPKTVTNFLNYVERGAYVNSIFHRLEKGYLLEGGGYTFSDSSVDEIATDGTIVNEFGINNVRGTIAMEKTGTGNTSTTNKWFINLADNRSTMDSSNGGYTVFARVIGDGMLVVDSIANETVFDATENINASFNKLPLTSSSFSYSSMLFIYYVKVIPIFPESNGGYSVIKFTATSSDYTAAAPTINGSLLTINRIVAGEATITVTAKDTNGRHNSLVFKAGNLGAIPVFDTQPLDVSVPAGGTLALGASVQKNNTASYQWMRNGVAIPGATQSSLVIDGMTKDLAGSYSVVATNSWGSTTSRAATVTLASSSYSLIKALSVRAYLEDSQRVIVGYVTNGPRELLLTGIGPGLASSSLPLSKCLADPSIEVYDSSSKVDANDNYPASSVEAMLRLRGAVVGSKLDSALVSTLSGVHMTHLIAKGSGVGLTEVYDGGTSMNGRLIAISARCFASTDERALTVGFVIGGDSAKTVLVRGIGPSLPSEIINRLYDPMLDVYNLATGEKIATNDDWNSSIEPAMLRTMGSNAAFSSNKDSALLVTLPPGIYSAVVRGVNDTEGEAMAEVYEVQ
jgi:cyclophilin family peptidyl-prolyl cis-trans isomerase